MRILILLALFGFTPVLAYADIYRWIDAEGRVHFGERPQPGAESVDVKPQIIERDDQVREREANLLRLQQVRGQERDMQQRQQLEQQARQQAQCDRLNNELARFDTRMYWYEEDPSGKKVEVSRERVEEQKMQLHAVIRERC